MPYTLPRNAGSPGDPMFPTLTPAQQARIAAHGRVRQVETGETLVDPDDSGISKFFVVVKGSPWATFGEGISSVWRQQSVKDRLQSPSFTRCLTSRKTRWLEKQSDHIVYYS
jgi:hypothetical protein